MKKYLLLILTVTAISHADDLDLGSDFSSGDTVSASAFNSRFNEIEKTIGAVKDSYLIGAWTCTFLETNQNGPFAKPTNDAFLYTMTDTITFSESDTSSSLNNPKSWATTDAYGAFIVGSTGGRYSLVGNTLYVTSGPDAEDTYNGQRFYIIMTSEDQFSLEVLQRGGGSQPPEGIFCNKN